MMATFEVTKIVELIYIVEAESEFEAERLVLAGKVGPKYEKTYKAVAERIEKEAGNAE